MIAMAAVLAPIVVEVLRRFRIPGVVIEIGLGIIIGPQVLKLAEVGNFVGGLSDLGLSFLMFLAGYEIDLQEIKGQPLVRAASGWGISLALAFGFAYVAVSTGFGLSTLFIGLTLTTTALGTLLPMLRDAGVAETRFGAFVLAIGTVGEFGPIVAIALLLTSDNPISTSSACCGGRGGSPKIRRCTCPTTSTPPTRPSGPTRTAPPRRGEARPGEVRPAPAR